MQELIDESYRPMVLIAKLEEEKKTLMEKNSKI